ncbi:G-protein alpha subunit-domain-containing protein [Tricladium varicosporioides]|nr:G-protein alpha subunit-domain-containing protein [Hymenoscyphus varicosporioides]
MADPISIIGAIGAVANIVDVVVKTISTLRELHNQWRESDFTLVNLISQLVCLKAGLNKIQEWLDFEEADPHHQLVMDLEVSLSCCRILVSKIEAHTLDLKQNGNSTLDLENKMKFLVRKGTLEDLQRMVERQSIGITLLLTACNCKIISGQKTILERPASRKIFRQVRDDSSSLYAQRDSSSLHSAWSGTLSNMSKISQIFHFDRDLFVTKVYERAMRQSMKDVVKTLGPQQPQVLSPQRRSALMTKEMFHSRRIDRTLEAESKRLRKVSTVLVLGDPSSSQKIVQAMKVMNQTDCSDEERRIRKPAIRKNLMTIMEAMIEILQDENYEFDESLTRIKRLLMQDLKSDQNTEIQGAISKSAAMAIQSFWRHDDVRRSLLKSKKWKVADSPVYFIEQVTRLASKTYVPNHIDILNSTPQNPTIGIYETDIPWGELSIHIVDISTCNKGPKVHKWMHTFSSVTSIIFSVDLCTYSTTLPETLEFFTLIVNSRFFKYTSIILFFTNLKRFSEAILHTPLSTRFPNYTGGTDTNRATKFLLWRFIQANRANLPTYPQLIKEESDPDNVQIIFTAIKETLLNNALRHSGILEKFLPESKILGTPWACPPENGRMTPDRLRLEVEDEAEVAEGKRQRL